MTYCCGWTSGSSTFLIGDAAITSAKPLAPDNLTSTFGEVHSSSEGEYVSERALKVLPVGRSALALAGDVNVAQSLAESFSARIQEGEEPLEGMRLAVSANGPFSDEREVQLLLAHHISGAPRLTCWTSRSPSEYNETTDAAHIGSLDRLHRRLSDQFIDYVNHRKNHPPAKQLAHALTFVQAFGVYDYLVERGVGGAFAGLYVDEHGVHWQPDILYALVDVEQTSGGLVAVVARRNALAVKSTLSGDAKVFGNTVCTQMGDDYVQYFDKEIHHIMRAAEFDYVAFFNLGKHIVTSVEMRKEARHRDLRLRVITDPDDLARTGIEFEMSEKLVRMLSSPGKTVDGKTTCDVSFRALAYAASSSPQQD